MELTHSFQHFLSCGEKSSILIKMGEKKVKKFVRGNRKTFVKLVVTSRECDQRGEEV